jgi:hypothetical protein
MSEPLRDWEDWRLAQELQFPLRFEKAASGEQIDMHSRILCEAVARILLRLPAKTNDWISVKERLPEEGEGNRVIIFADKRAPFEPEVLWGYYEAKKWYSQWGKCERITHWQPMPDPPKAAKESSK